MKEQAERFFEFGMEKDFPNLSIREISSLLDEWLEEKESIIIDGVEYESPEALKEMNISAYKELYDYYKTSHWDELEELDEEERERMEDEDE